MAQYFSIILFLFIILVCQVASLLPPKFQWRTLDFAWGESVEGKQAAIKSGKYVPNNNMPTGLARWKDKLFITIPRWKTGVPSSLNYVYLNDSQDAPLHPYPNWEEGCLTRCGAVASNRTVVSTFRVHVDNTDHLWVVDNGVQDMATSVKQVVRPALLVFDLNSDELVAKHVFSDDVLRDTSVLTSVVVDTVDCTKGHDCSSYAYITDMGSNALIVYNLKSDEAWRVENHYFHFDPHAGVYKVGGIDFYWKDGVSSAALSRPRKDGNCDVYLQPTSSTKQFKISTELLRNKNVPHEDIFNGVEIVGDRGPNSQITACDIDHNSNVLFFTQVCKNGLACWNLDNPYTPKNTPVILSDCKLLEFPNDIKVDTEGNVWILSNRQSRFLYETMDFSQVNYRVLMAPSHLLTQDTPCAAKCRRNVSR